MTEEFLHYLWRFRKFQQLGLNTESGEPVTIIHTGNHNHDSGPDFGEAKVQIGEQLWAGNVEIHVSSSDWNKHGHADDKAYDNVILHVVYEDDSPVRDKNGQVIPTLVLKGLFDEQAYWKYEQLVQAHEVIPCASQFAAVDDMIKESMLERALVERLEMKAAAIQELWEQNNRNWNETFYQWMARGFGLKVNAEPMLMLARALPQNILAKHKDHLFQLEALLFGTAGMLKDSDEDYARELNKEFQFLKSKYNLDEMDASVWKFSRLRPPAFPTVRIGQFAALIHRSENLFSKVLGIGSLKVLEQLLSDSPSIYWREHYRFGSEHNRTKAGMGKSFQETLVINVVVPFLFIYGKMKEENFYCQRAMDLLDQMGGEDNKITRLYKNLGLEMDTAFRSQAAIQLNQHYCSLKKCLNCSIGIHLIR